MKKPIPNSFYLQKGYKAKRTERYQAILNNLSEDMDIPVNLPDLLECIGYLQQENQRLLNEYNRFKNGVIIAVLQGINKQMTGWENQLNYVEKITQKIS